MARIRIDRSVPVAMRDGVVLRADVWRPDDDRPRPAVLTRTPYGRAASEHGFLRPWDCLDAGYAFVIQDCRGHGESEGEWGLLDGSVEGPDGHDSVEWTASQDWCDGNVVMAGASYAGIAQWAAAERRPPSLRAIAPAMSTGADLERRAAGGAFRLNQTVAWLAYMALEWLQRDAPAADRDRLAARLVELADDPGAALAGRRLEELAADFDRWGLPASVCAMAAGRGFDAAAGCDVTAVAVPTLSITGWFDVHCSAVIETVQRLWAHGGAHELVVGPWTHDRHLPQVQGQVNFGLSADAAYLGLSALHLDFFDRRVRGDGAAAAPRVRYFLMGADEWRTCEHWPPEQARPHVLYLTSEGRANTADGDGRLVPTPPGADRADEFVHDPADPVPTRGGRVAALGRLVGGPLDRSRVQARPDVLCYTTEPLARPLELVGPVLLRLHTVAEAPAADVVAKLTDVAPDGTALPLAEGALRLGGVRGGGAEGSAAREPQERRIRLGHTAWRVPAGHRLRLEIAGSDYPQLGCATGDGGVGGRGVRGRRVRQSVLHGPLRPSRLEVGVLESG